MMENKTILLLLDLINKFSENFLEPDEVRIVLFSDGSGRLEYLNETELFDFENIDELFKKLEY